MAVEEFTIRAEESAPGQAVVWLSGNLNAAAIERLDNAFTELFKYEVYKIVVDLSELYQISSAGIGSLLNAYSTVQENNGFLKVRGASNRILESFSLVGFTPELEK